MHNYPLRVVEAMIVSGQSLEAIEDFIENGTQPLRGDPLRAVAGAWTETSREIDHTV